MSKSKPTEKRTLQCYISLEAYNKVQDLVGKGDDIGSEPLFGSVSEYLNGLIYADLSRRGLLNKKICPECLSSNAADAKYCSICGNPLTPSGIEREIKIMRLFTESAPSNMTDIEALGKLSESLGKPTDYIHAKFTEAAAKEGKTFEEWLKEREEEALKGKESMRKHIRNLERQKKILELQNQMEKED